MSNPQQPQNQPVPQHYDVQKVAATLNMSPRWIRQQIADGHLVAARFGHKLVVSATHLNAFVAEHENTIPAAS
jgi:hypothetical protein